VGEKLPPAAIEQMLEKLDRWQKVFPTGDTWVGRKLGVPSLIVRLDCTYDNGCLNLFEIEERPCGVGVSQELDPVFREKLNALRAEWPQFQWVEAANRVTDDQLWLGRPLSLEAALASDCLVLVRSRPEAQEYHPLESRSVSSVQHEGDKNYGVALGLWDIVKWQYDPDPENKLKGYVDPAFTSPCVVKPLQGTRCREVTVFFNGHITFDKAAGNKVPMYNGAPLIKRSGDSVGLERLEKMIRRHSKMVRQPYIPPMRRDHVPDKNVIYRFFLGYSPHQKRYVPLGGVWAASDSLLVHGEEGTIFGPLYCPEC
jgi:hypothetical protein